MEFVCFYIKKTNTQLDTSLLKDTQLFSPERGKTSSTFLDVVFEGPETRKVYPYVQYLQPTDSTLGILQTVHQQCLIFPHHCFWPSVSCCCQRLLLVLNGFSLPSSVNVKLFLQKQQICNLQWVVSSRSVFKLCPTFSQSSISKMKYDFHFLFCHMCVQVTCLMPKHTTTACQKFIINIILLPKV